MLAALLTSAATTALAAPALQVYDAATLLLQYADEVIPQERVRRRAHAALLLHPLPWPPPWQRERQHMCWRSGPAYCAAKAPWA